MAWIGVTSQVSSPFSIHFFLALDASAHQWGNSNRFSFRFFCAHRGLIWRHSGSSEAATQWGQRQSKSILRQKRKQRATDPIYFACQRMDRVWCVKCSTCSRVFGVTTIAIPNCTRRVSTIRCTSMYREWKGERKRERTRSSSREWEWAKSSRRHEISTKNHMCVCSVFEQADAKLTLNRTEKMPRWMAEFFGCKRSLKLHSKSPWIRALKTCAENVTWASWKAATASTSPPAKLH